MGNNCETKNGKLKKAFEKPLTRRTFLKKSATGAAVAFTAASMGPFVRTSKAAKLRSPGGVSAPGCGGDSAPGKMDLEHPFNNDGQLAPCQIARRSPRQRRK